MIERHPNHSLLLHEHRTMITYTLNNYQFSTDLKRFARKVGQDHAPKYTLGYCKIEFVPQGNSVFMPRPTTLDESKPMDKITIHDAVLMDGQFCIQTTTEHELSSAEDKDQWIAPANINLPSGVLSVEAYVEAEIKASALPDTEASREMTLERLKVEANVPEATSTTVKAIILHTGQVRAELVQDERVDRLKSSANITKHQAQVLANCVNDGCLVFRDGDWHTPIAKFYTPPKESELTELINAGMLKFVKHEVSDKSEYQPTELGIQLVRDSYL